nr:MAG TPA: hypothetical protein [Caudoviricetes sp.]
MRRRPRRPRPVARCGRQGHGQARPRAREALMPCRSSPRPTDLPADEATPPRGRDARGPRLRRVFRDPTRQIPQGRPDTDRARRRLGAHPREGKALLPYVPGRLELVSASKLWFPAGPGRGPLLEEGPPDAARYPGIQQG